PLIFANSRIYLWPEFPVESTCPESFRQCTSNHFRSFYIRLDHQRSWHQNQNDSPHLFAIVHCYLAALTGCSAATHQMDQNGDMKHPLQQLLLPARDRPMSVCRRDVSGYTN